MELTQRINRLGLFTASSIYKLMVSGKAKDQLFGKEAMTYIYEKIAEIVTGESPIQARSASLEWGNENEKDASMWLQQTHPHKYHGKEDAVFYPYCKYAGGSPDGLHDDYVVELKCPYVSANHIQWLVNKSQEWLKKSHFDYYVQVQFNMACTGKETGIIASYDPRTVEHAHRMAIIEIERDEDLLNELCHIRIPAAGKIIGDALKTLS